MRLTLKQFITLSVLLILAFVAQAQSYNSIEFIENKGQWDPRVKFKGDVNAGAFFIRSGGFTVLQYNQQDYDQVRSAIVGHPGNKPVDPNGKLTLRGHAYNVDFVDASPNMQVVPEKVTVTYNNYFIGNDPSKWASNCRIFQAITFKDVYPNVDVRYYTDRGTLKYDIIAKPGADIKKIALRYVGTDKLSVRDKELIVNTSVGELKESYPYSYQADTKGRKQVSCKYIVKDNIVRFDVKDYDPKSTLIIDPLLIFCSFAGSSADNWGFTATYGPDGSFYGGGIVFDNGWPVSPGAFQTGFQGGVSDHPEPIDMGIIRLSPNGANRIFATYIGGSGNDQPHSLVVDAQGEVVVCGRSNSSNYPVTGSNVLAGAAYDIVITKLNATGTALIGSKKIGGSGSDGVNINITNNSASSLQHNYGDGSRSEVILDGAGNIYVASCTQSKGDNSTTKFPVSANAFQQTFGGGGQDAVVLKFDPSVANLLFSSYLGGDGNDAGYVLSIAPTGDIYVAGGTESHVVNNAPANSFPGNHAGTVNPLPLGGIDGFVAQISNNGNTLIRSTFIGTTAYDQIYGIQFDRNGFPYVMGQTTGNWPVINATYSVAGSKQFIGKLQPDLSAYVYSTIFGSPNAIVPNISPTAFLVDRCENVYVSGWGGEVAQGYANAGTFNMPVTADAIKSTTDGHDFYFFVLKKDAVSQLYGSYFGQNGGFTDHVDGGTSRFDANGVIYQAICANCESGNSTPFPTTPGAWASVKPGSAFCNLAMVKISFNLAGVGSDVESEIGGVPKDTAGCVPLDVTFTDLVRNATEYIWNFGDGTGDIGPLPAATGYTQTHTFNAVGTYLVTLVAINPTSCNIRDTSYVHIRVGDLKANLAATYSKLATAPCESFDYEFRNLSTTAPSRPFTNTSFIWKFGDGSAPVIAGLNTLTHQYPGPGTYTAWLILNDTAYCNNPDSISLDVRVAANVEAKFETPPVGCAPYTADFSNTSIGGQTFDWNFGDPASGANNTSTATNPSHLYATTGTYTITLIATDPNTCNKTDTTTATIVVFEKPIADFSYTPVIPVENTPDVFTNLSSPIATRFKWLFGDGDTLATTSRAPVTHQYNSTGTFNACLVAFNDAGCSDTACKDVSTIVIPALDVPNAFTPNSGDVNSKVFVRGFGISKMRFIIWNRWGQKVFEAGSPSQGWDGRVKGIVQPMDVYAYTLDVEFFDGTKATRKGDITLIR